jgi:hypothetical protein
MYRCTSVVIHTNIYYPTKFFFFVKFSQYSLHVLNILFTFAVGYPLLVGGGGRNYKQQFCTNAGQCRNIAYAAMH